MTVYRDTAQAIARVMSIETIDGTAKSSWQEQYESGWPELRERGCGLSRTERLTQDCVTRKILHEGLGRQSVMWHALVAKYSINDHEVCESVRWLVPRIESPAHHLFKMKCCAAWAIPRKRGTDGAKTSRRGLPEAFYELHTWDSNGTPDSTLRRWRSITKGWLDDRVDDAFDRSAHLLACRGLLIQGAA